MSQPHKKYFEKNYFGLVLHLKEIYLTACIVSSNTNVRCFQYNVLRNAFFLNKKLLFKKSNTPLCSFSKEEDKTIFHLYFFYASLRNLWKQLKVNLEEDLTLPPRNTAGYCFWLLREKKYGQRNTS